MILVDAEEFDRAGAVIDFRRQDAVDRDVGKVEAKLAGDTRAGQIDMIEANAEV